MCGAWFEGGARRLNVKRLMLLIVAALVLTGCNTFEGLGKDVQKAGETLENAAKKK